MNYSLTDPPPIAYDVHVVFERKCTQFLFTPLMSKRDETLQKDLSQWRTFFSDLPRFADLNTDQLAKMETFVTAGIRLAYYTFSDITIAIDNDFDTLNMSLEAGSFIFSRPALDCLNELDQLSEHVVINASARTQHSMDIFIMIAVQELQR